MEHSLQALRPRRSLGTESIDIFTLDPDVLSSTLLFDISYLFAQIDTN